MLKRPRYQYDVYKKNSHKLKKHLFFASFNGKVSRYQLRHKLRKLITEEEKIKYFLVFQLVF